MRRALAPLAVGLAFVLGCAAAQDAADAGRPDAWLTVFKEMAGAGYSAPLRASFDALPAAVKSRVQAASAKIASGDPVGAARVLRAVAREHPGVAGVAWLQAQALQASGDADAALALLRAATGTDRGVPELWRDLASLDAGRGDRRKAAASFNQAEACDPQDPWVHVLRVRFLQDELGIDAVKEQLDAAAAKCPGSGGVRLLLEDFRRLAARPAWKRIFVAENRAFSVASDTSEERSAEFARRLEIHRRFLERALPLGVQPKAPGEVWIFSSEEGFRDFIDRFGRHDSRTAGLYDPVTKRLFVCGRLEAPLTQHALFHEAFHQYLGLAVASPPPWFNEGLAEYYGSVTFDPAGEPVEGSVLTERVAVLQSGLASQPLAAFRRLMLMPRTDFMGADVELHYAQSWAIVHFLKRGKHPGASEALHRYAAALLDGSSQREAFEASFGALAPGSLAGVEAAFTSYVRSL